MENADYLDGGDVPYLVFEYLDGKDVSDLVKGQVLGPADTIRLGVEAATGLAFLHANGVYHCDIKPSNLLWTDQRLQDHRLQRGRAVLVQLVQGGRLAPVRATDVSRAAPPSAVDLADRDVYALGVTLYQVLTGRYPFPSGAPALGETATDPRTVAELSELSDALVDTLLRAIAPLRERPVRQRRGVPCRAAGDRGGAPQARARAARRSAAGSRHAEREPVRRPLAVPLQPVHREQRGHQGRGRNMAPTCRQRSTST